MEVDVSSDPVSAQVSLLHMSGFRLSVDHVFVCLFVFVCLLVSRRNAPEDHVSPAHTRTQSFCGAALSGRGMLSELVGPTEAEP